MARAPPKLQVAVQAPVGITLSVMVICPFVGDRPALRLEVESKTFRHGCPR